MIQNRYEYDHQGRLAKQWNKIGDQPEILLTENEFNILEQVTRKKIGKQSGGVFATTIDQQFTETGWLKKISSPQFTQEMKHETPSDLALAQYNGNISEQNWQHGVGISNKFQYKYDYLGRMIEGLSTGTVMKEILSYDKMGNINSLARDNSTTNYQYVGNQLMSLSGGLSASYTYDKNGNATKDRSGMTFTYNELDLISAVTKTGTTISYIYDADGLRLRKESVINGISSQRDYIQGIQYNKAGSASSVIDLIEIENGYIQNNSGVYSYFFNIADNLGNIRSTINSAGVVVQKDDYYPFGKRKSAGLTNGINKYLYNGKEIQEEIGGQYDYGARFYDPEIGRWNVVDPLAEAAHNWSPYRYAYDNPINFIDPNGMIEYSDDYKGRLGKGDWRTSDRLNNTRVWSSANEYNTRNGRKNQYAAFAQVRDYYSWVKEQSEARGHEVKWMKGALGLVDALAYYLEGGNWLVGDDVEQLLAKLNVGIQNGTMNAFNELLYGKYSSSPLKGHAAQAWDEALVNYEQGQIAPPIYYVAVTTEGESAGVDQLFATDFNQKIQSSNAQSNSRSAVVKLLKKQKGEKLNCTVSTDIIEESADYMLAKVTLKFENFTKTDLVTLEREGNDWKVSKSINSYK
ncbi:hypothetical protein AAW12_02635 [Sphingobacterium sp. Ag1]|uniref:RHS repeat domain-containing protein n=1 Tax=Sphingobacterium sp. Ag1 TaxID=1643451 RepID=UPI0006280532|nr:RHS repeat-associated core domain-containing protein [Sphingobacterium sp. Ag1]KKO92847.1 hypothetical protein AAW12_02635 [Sphingobacterium sp. Ag1]